MIKDEIKDFTDGYGLISPRKVEPGKLRSCDNGVLYLADYVICRVLNNEPITPNEKVYLSFLLASCLNAKGNLCRAPGAKDQDSVDNHYGLFALVKILGCSYVAKFVKDGMLSNFGFTNNEKPGSIYREDGTINWDAFLVRQIQLDAAMLSASGTNRFYHAPLYWYTALVIATSCIKTDPGNTDARRLCYMLIHAVAPDSWLCRQAAKLWFRRLYKHYGPLGMKAVNAIYFTPGDPNHPILKYTSTTDEIATLK